MNPAIQKTLALVILLGIGFLLRKKIYGHEEKKGLKTLILTVALPAIIFVALLKVEFRADLLLLPLLVVAFNALMFFVLQNILPWYGINRDTRNYRTYLLLFPSLAPGLSCFPFLIEYLGDDVLAWGALADIGNKFSVLILAYLVAFHWFVKNHPSMEKGSSQKLKSLLVSLVNEPINMVIIVALLLLTFGLNFASLPTFLGNSIVALSSMMTPLVLIYIGISMIFNWQQIKKISSLLLLRSGICFLLSALLLSFYPGLSYAAAMLIIVFPQSAISFWPFAHISAINAKESEIADPKRRTFDTDLAVNILAVSLPFSILIMLGAFSIGQPLASPMILLGMGGSFILLSFAGRLFRYIMLHFSTTYFRNL